LIHKIDRTIRPTQIEAYIYKILNEKILTRDILFLGTEFEAGRIKDNRVDDVFHETIMNPVARELKKLNESLLSSSIDYTKSESSFDEKTLELLKRTLFDFFRGIDKNDLGIVSYKECAEVLRKMEIDLNEIELNNLMIIADKNGNGMIEYKEFIPIGAEVLHGLLLK